MTKTEAQFAADILTTEELKAIADAMGYKVVKKQRIEPFKPCLCGHNRRSHIYSWGVKGVTRVEGYRCCNCGLEVWGKNSAEAKRKWNEKIEGVEGTTND